MTVPKAELQQRLRAFDDTCGRKGLRVTHQRMEVFRALASSDAHPDAETVYQRVRARVTGISRDTVYRTLATLESEGLIRKAGTLKGPTRYDANMANHHHFVCTSCGRVKDFYSEKLDDLPLPETVAAFGRIDSAQVQVRGVCASCAKRKTRSRRRSPT